MFQKKREISRLPAEQKLINGETYYMALNPVGSYHKSIRQTGIKYLMNTRDNTLKKVNPNLCGLFHLQYEEKIWLPPID